MESASSVTKSCRPRTSYLPAMLYLDIWLGSSKEQTKRQLPSLLARPNRPKKSTLGPVPTPRLCGTIEAREQDGFKSKPLDESLTEDPLKWPRAKKRQTPFTSSVKRLATITTSPAGSREVSDSRSRSIVRVCDDIPSTRKRKSKRYCRLPLSLVHKQ